MTVFYQESGQDTYGKFTSFLEVHPLHRHIINRKPPRNKHLQIIHTFSPSRDSNLRPRANSSRIRYYYATEAVKKSSKLVVYFSLCNDGLILRSRSSDTSIHRGVRNSWLRNKLHRITALKSEGKLEKPYQPIWKVLYGSLKPTF